MAKIKWPAFSTIVADTPAQIRQCDVFRLLSIAAEAGGLQGCITWLHQVRPDLDPEVAECLPDLVEEGYL